jgi:outer membrane protein assembly factor BamB
MVRSGLRAGSVVWMAVGMVLSVLLVSVAPGENWPRFRGPNGQGISEARGIPTKWSEQDYRWKITLPGGGHSSPVVWGDRVFVTCADATTRRGVLLCLSADDGRELWRQEQDLTRYPLNGLNSYASPTPALDAERVYALWPSGDETVLKAFSHGGGEAWTLRLGGVHVRHGQGSSPMVYGDYVIVSHEQERNNDGVTSQWLAIERNTGQVKWRREEPSVENASYSTPCVFRSEGGPAQLVFTSNAHGVTGVDPETGNVVWTVDSVLPDRVVSSPVIAGDFVMGTCGQGGRGKRLAAVRPRHDGAAFAATESYGLETRIVPYVPTSLAYQGLLFAFHDNGVVSCLKSDTGETVWSEKPAGRFYGSPICVNGVLYCVTIEGEVVALEAGPTYKLLAVNPLGEKSHATPAVGGGRLYLRTVSHLIALGGGG